MDLTDLLIIVVKTFDRRGISYFVTGSVASISYGEPRLTNDIDIVADISEKHIASLIKDFPSEEFYISEEAILDAIRRGGQFNIIHPTSGLKVDVIIKQQGEFDKSRFQRCKKISVGEHELAVFASPEDVIIKKMEYYREGGSEKHLRDITGIMKVSEDMIDITYIEQWANKLGLTDIWHAILNRISK